MENVIDATEDVIKKRILSKIKEFKRLLKDKGAYIPFVKAYHEQNEVRERWVGDNFNFKKEKKFSCSSFEQYGLIVKEYDFLQYAFRWEDSDQKHNYWSKLNCIWKSYIKSGAVYEDFFKDN